MVRNYNIEALEKLLDCIPYEIYLKDNNNKYIYVNKSFEKTCGKKREDILNKKAEDLFSESKTRFINKLNRRCREKSVGILSEGNIDVNGINYCYEFYEQQFYPSNRVVNNSWIGGISRNLSVEKKFTSNFYYTIPHKNFYLLNKDEYIKFTEKANKCRINDLCKYLCYQLNAEGISIYVYNKHNKTLNFYTKTGNVNVNELVDTYYVEEELFTNILFENIYETLRPNNQCAIFTSKTKNPSEGLCSIYKMSYYNELMGILNIHYNKDYKESIHNRDSIKSIAYQFAILFKSLLTAKDLNLELQKRKEMEKQNSIFLDIAADLYALITLDGKFLSISKKWCTTFGYTKEELLKMNLSDLIAPCHNLSSSDLIKLFTSKKVASKERYTYICKNGSKRIIDWNWKNMSENNYVMITGSDITEKVKLEKEKLEVEKALEIETLKTEFFANMSHEFRTPINIILSAIQILNDNYTDSFDSYKNEKFKGYLKAMKQNSYRLMKLINNLIDLTKIDGGYYEVKMQNCNIVNIIENIVSSVVIYMENINRHIIFDTEEEEIILACDTEKIERIMLNLISNAVKFTNANGNILINIKLSKDKKNIIVSVWDDGIKIKDSDAKIIFERFKQTDNLLNRRCEGSGIGLSLVKSLVELHNGTIWANTNVTKGAEICFTLPIRKCKGSNLINTNTQIDNKVLTCNIEFSDIYS